MRHPIGPGPAAWVLATTVLLLPSVSQAICIGVPFEKELARTEVIAAGTVDSVWVEDLPHGNVVTHYKLSDVRYAKGAGPNEGLVVTECGGRTERGTEACEGAVHLRMGTRYILLLARGRAGFWAPFLMLNGCSPGYMVAADSMTGRQVVRAGGSVAIRASVDTLVMMQTSAREPEKRIAGRDSTGQLRYESIVSVLHPSSDAVPSSPFLTQESWPDKDPGTRASEKEFLAWLRAAAARSARPDSGGPH